MSKEDASAKAHRDLVRAAAVAQGPRGIVERLIDVVGEWALFLDARGELVAAVPPGARGHLHRVQTELEAVAENAHGPTVLVNRPGDSLAVRSVRVAGRVRGYLAVGSRQTLSELERSLLDTATHLLAGELHRDEDLLQAARNNEQAIFDLLVGGEPADVVLPTAATLGVQVPDGLMRIALLGTTDEQHAELLRSVEEDIALRRVGRIIAEVRHGRVGVVMPQAQGDFRTLEAIVRRIPHTRGAIGEPVQFSELARSWIRVQGMFRSALQRPGRLMAISEVAGLGLLKHLETDEAREWSSVTLSALHELNSGSRVDYVKTLRVFLANNGRPDASANALQIHRHTLRYRVNQIESALKRDLDDPTVRTELWIALHLAQTAPAQTAPAQTAPAQTAPAHKGPAQPGVAQPGAAKT